MSGNATHVPYEHLLGRAWKDCDCRAAVRAVYDAAGIALPEGALGYPASGCWERVGDTYRDATRALDVIASDPTGTGAESHVSVLIRTGPPWTVVTSSIAAGVQAMRPGALKNVRGVYRLRVNP